MKKTLSTLLALTLILSLFAACAGDTGSPGNGEGAATSQTPGGEDSSDGLLTPSGQLPIVTAPTTVNLVVQKYGPVEDYVENHYTKYIEENTGLSLNIELYPQAEDEAVQKMEVLIASGAKLPDAFLGDAFFGQTNKEISIFRHAQNGVFIELDDLIEQHGHNMKEMVAKAANKDFMSYITSPDGHIYMLPKYNEQTSNEYSLRAYINGAWLEKLNLEMPATTEDLYEVLKAFRDGDPNGNGQPDEIGVMGGGSWHQLAAEFLLNAFIYDDHDYRWNVRDGQLDVPYNKEEWREGLRYINRLVSEGLFDPLSFTQDGPSFKAIAQSGEDNNIGVIVTAGMGQLFDASDERKGEYIPLAPLTGPEGVSYAARYPITPGPCMVITKDCENPEILMRMGDFMMSEESSVFSRFGKPEEDWVVPGEGAVALGAAWGAEPALQAILIWGGASHSSHWGAQTPMILLQKYTDGQAWNGNPIDAEYMIAQAVPGLLGKEPAEIATKILYNAEENAAVADIQTTLTTYVNESKARFATGDLSLDSDWDSYLQELENIGLQRYIEVSQTAYDRQMGR